MEKRSRRRIRDLVAHPASQGLDANENRCARISMMARSANAPLKGRIQKRKTNNLQIITSGLQRTAGPYRCANSCHPDRLWFNRALRSLEIHHHSSVPNHIWDKFLGRGRRKTPRMFGARLPQSSAQFLVSDGVTL